MVPGERRVLYRVFISPRRLKKRLLQILHGAPLYSCLQDVANAVGAALGTVGGACDLVVSLGPIREALTQSPEGEELAKAGNLDDRVRRVALERGREHACNEVRRKKGNHFLYALELPNVDILTPFTVRTCIVF